jgi:hypothetical protein
MAEGKKPAAMTIAGVIELVFSILIFIYAIVFMVIGCANSAVGLVGAAGNAMEGAKVNEGAMTAAATGAGIMMIITVILSLAAIAMGVIGIIGASNLFKGKKAGVGLSNFWAIALIIIFLIGLVPSILSLANAGAAAAGIQNLTEAAKSAGTSMSTDNVNVNPADVQAVGTGMGITGIVLSFIFYALPAIIVFIMLKAKPVKDFFAAPQA